MATVSALLAHEPVPDALRDQIILVTGAGDGLGRAIAVGAARYGATVVLLGKTVHKLENTYDAIASDGGPQAAIYPLDLSGANPEHFDQMVDTIERELGGLNAVVHCAAQLGPMTPIDGYPAADWLKTMQVNFNAPVILTQACLPLLSRQETANIVFTGDRRERAYWGAYACSKAALETATKVLADELDTQKNREGARKFSVNSVCPTPMRTALRRLAYPGEDASRNAPADACVPPYLYLLNPSTEKPNGETILCAG